jgi:hypothetical protein
MPAKRTSYFSPAACAFIASGIELLSYGIYLMQRSGMIESARSSFYFPPPSVFIALLLGLLGLAAQSRALWHVAGIQRAVAPFSARAGRWAVAAYVLVSILVLVVLVVRLSGVSRVAFWPLHMPRFALTIALLLLGWASRGNTNSWQRWASTGLLAMGALGILSIGWWVFGLPRGPRWVWPAALHVILRAATWAAVGAWLRRTEGLNEWH